MIQGQEGALVAIGLGSNRGDRRAHLDRARTELERILTRQRWSALYETDPEDLVSQPRFLNACCVGRTTLAPADLLGVLQRLEASVGRTPSQRFGPRELDLDLLLYGDLVLETERLRVPHPRMAVRSFVLVPLAEIAGGWRHPELDATVGELARAVNRSGIRARHEWA